MYYTEPRSMSNLLTSALGDRKSGMVREVLRGI